MGSILWQGRYANGPLPAGRFGKRLYRGIEPPRHNNMQSTVMEVGSMLCNLTEWLGVLVELRDKPDEAGGPDTEWRQAVLSAHPPFSFALDGAPSSTLLPQWTCSLDVEAGAGAGAGACRITWRELGGGLRVTATVRLHLVCGAVNYVLHIENEGTQDSPLLEDILPLDAVVVPPRFGQVRLHHARGSFCAPDDFLPLVTELEADAPLEFQPVGGKPSNAVLPFFNLTWPGGGICLAIGWTGQWKASFEREEVGPCRLAAGMAHTHLRLRPGERIRTPSVLLVPWQGQDWMCGQNRLRRVMLEHFTPRQDGVPVLPPVAHATSASLHMHDGGWAGGNEETQFESIRAIAPLGVEAYWLDAYWFPGNFPNGVGNWFPRQNDFPRGLRPLADEVHSLGMQFILWFEPERVGPGTRLAEEHPEWLLAVDDGSKLLDMGNPEARRHMTDLVSQIITDAGVDIYRQDFNMSPLPYWQANDCSDRQGMTEIRHVEGLYTFWDELLARHPGLWIDNCSGGGQRIDIESCRRSLPLWRSDTPDRLIWDEGGRAIAGAGDQVQTVGLSLFVPLHSGGVWGVDPYRFRSALHAGIVIYDDPRQVDFPRALAAKAISELKSLRPYFLGDFYPLTEITTSEEDWCAYQYHLADTGGGLALYFRRRFCGSHEMPAGLRGLDAAALYDVRLYETYDESDRFAASGAELRNLAVRVTNAPGSVLLKYELARETPDGPC